MSLEVLSRLTHRGNTDTFGLIIQEAEKKQVRRVNLLAEATTYDIDARLDVERIIDRAVAIEQRKKNNVERETVSLAVRVTGCRRYSTCGIYSVLRVFRASRNTLVFLAQWDVARA